VARKSKPAPKAAPVEIVVPTLPVSAPRTFGGPNSGNLGFSGIPEPRPLTGGKATPFNLDAPKGSKR